MTAIYTKMSQIKRASTRSAAHVIGSINRDIVAYVPHLPRAGETVLGTRGAFFPGGKGANQAVAIARLGLSCHLVGRIGADSFGREMRAFLDAEGVETSCVLEVANVATGFALITVDAMSENSITVVPGANACWPDDWPDIWPDIWPATPLVEGDIVVAQLEIPTAVVVEAFSRAASHGTRTILNPAPFQPLSAALLRMTDTIILNETELAGVLGQPLPPGILDLASISGPLNMLLEHGPSLAVITLGARGVLFQKRDRAPACVAAHQVTARDTTGAGDCFVGAFVAGCLEGHDTLAAVQIANAAAALSVTRDGAAASFPTRAEVDAFLRR